MIVKIWIQNFKSLRDVNVEPERFTVFVGPNASGKSSILQGLDLLCRSFRDQEGSVDGELSQAVSRGSNGPVELAAESGGKGYRYRSRSPSGPVFDGMEHGQPWSGEGRGVASDLNSGDWKHWPLNPNTPSPSPLPLSVLLRLETSKLIQHQPLTPDVTVMAPDGTGVHSALANMALNDPDSWQQLQACKPTFGGSFPPFAGCVIRRHR
jgi:hypothetical protein